MGKMCVLIVDDDKDILRMLEFNLKKLGENYHVVAVKNTSEALKKIEEEWFDLVLTDYMMPGMTGVDLARAVHRLSPDTQIILMTAYSSSKLRTTSDHIGFDGFLNKPFDMEQLRRLVEKTARQSKAERQARLGSNATPAEKSPAEETVVSNPSPQIESIEQHLQALKVNSGVQAVLLVNAEGQLLKTAGQIVTKNAGDIAKNIVESFLATSKLSNLLENKKTFKSSFYEGDAYNIYVCHVNQTSLLAVIFDVTLRPGVVWFYTKQTAVALSSLVK